MITYNDIKKNPLVLFQSPQIAERWHLLIASDGYHIKEPELFSSIAERWHLLIASVVYHTPLQEGEKQ
jgi:hypothetical protein